MNPTQGKKKKIRLLFVCLGNICRSPAAEGIMSGIIEKNGLQEMIEVDSAGTSGWHEGDLPDERMRLHGEKRGYNLCSRSRKIHKEDLSDFDYILAMDENNFRTVRAMATSKEEADKIHLMTDYLVQFRKLHDHIPDPYYGEASGFELVLDLLEDACEGLLLSIKRDHLLI
ncbi:MAG: low molecular weight protein-tyrosine-phosphatase [Proteiniphilum sp.]|jgi:protein-tyrosine phosphatase|nr:low molecular weight phosphotyrosine protein phosphatase [Proteiniphilum sp.]NCD14174.1 low molecular weight phosphotyrosine protein phosphatase [Bacteroidia bacterium]HHT35434.1 low molecular weight phosphotyrosine protein phosphatase [Bacteroidales bacterium]MDD2726180.1 low molecular weight phosphotyrosine protein phosphatase [Proteiniphilum sp.]MDD3332389.1 low molecular weight phosphotyrosine protein phosphatase [Proteiniphilum sp.]